MTTLLASGQWEESLRSHPTFGRAYSAIASQIDLAGELKNLTANVPVFTALVQGGLGGLMFVILGIPGAFLWGAAMAVLSLVPSLGSFVIWIPAAIIFASQGAWVKAVVLAGWGVFVVTIGGLVIFGAAGIVLGPIILAATVAMLEIFRRRTRREESAQHLPAPCVYTFCVCARTRWSVWAVMRTSIRRYR